MSSPPPAVDDVGAPASPSSERRRRRVDSSRLAHQHGTDVAAVVGHAECASQGRLTPKVPEETRAEPGVHRRQQHDHGGEAPVDEPVGHRPRTCRLHRHVCGVGVRGPRRRPAAPAPAAPTASGPGSLPPPSPLRALSGSRYRARYASGSTKRATTTGARRRPGHRRERARQSAVVVASQNREVSSGPVRTTASHPPVLPADGAEHASSSTWSSTSSGTGSPEKLRTILRRRAASDSSMDEEANHAPGAHRPGVHPSRRRRGTARSHTAIVGNVDPAGRV